MNKTIFIYLAGTIKKGKEDKEEAWTEEEMEKLKSYLQHVKVQFLNPASRSDDLSDQKSVFGRDLFQVYSSTFVLVDARNRRGLGVGAEMMFAKMYGIPVISWLPPESHYNRESLLLLGQEVKGWIHPFVYNLSDYLAPSLREAAEWMQQFLSGKKVDVKGADSIQECLYYYLDTQLARDHGMDELVRAHPHLVEKVRETESV